MQKYAEVQMKRKFIHFHVNCSKMFFKNIIAILSSTCFSW